MPLQAIKARTEAEKKKQEKKAALARPTRANSFPGMSPSHVQQAVLHRDSQAQPSIPAAVPAMPQAESATIAFPAAQSSQHSLPLSCGTEQAQDAGTTAAAAPERSQQHQHSSVSTSRGQAASQTAHVPEQGKALSQSPAAEPVAQQARMSVIAPSKAKAGTGQWKYEA